MRLFYNQNSKEHKLGKQQRGVNFIQSSSAKYDMKYIFYEASYAVFQPKIRATDKSKLSFIWGVSAFI